MFWEWDSKKTRVLERCTGFALHATNIMYKNVNPMCYNLYFIKTTRTRTTSPLKKSDPKNENIPLCRGLRKQRESKLQLGVPLSNLVFHFAFFRIFFFSGPMLKKYQVMCCIYRTYIWFMTKMSKCNWIWAAERIR